MEEIRRKSISSTCPLIFIFDWIFPLKTCRLGRKTKKIKMDVK